MDLDAETASQDDPMHQLKIGNLCSFDEYIAVDDGLQCSPMPTNQDIVSSVMQVSEEDEEGDDTGDPLPSVTYKQAYFCFPGTAVISLEFFPGKRIRKSL